MLMNLQVLQKVGIIFFTPNDIVTTTITEVDERAQLRVCC
jgi:hypothetical protein